MTLRRLCLNYQRCLQVWYNEKKIKEAFGSPFYAGNLMIEQLLLTQQKVNVNINPMGDLPMLETGLWDTESVGMGYYLYGEPPIGVIEDGKRCFKSGPNFWQAFFNIDVPKGFCYCTMVKIPSGSSGDRRYLFGNAYSMSRGFVSINAVNGALSDPTTPFGAVPLDKWFHLAINGTSKGLDFYINGVFDCSSKSAVLWDRIYPIAQYDNFFYTYNSAVFLRELTSDEIRSVYNQSR